MQPQQDDKNAVVAIRVSTTKQGTDGDSPEAQKEQAERFAQNKGATIKKFFVFLESASKDQQPMQEAIDYCIDPKNKIDLFIIKSIDRFTRGGSLPYDLLKSQLEAHNVKLVDIYGIISSEKVNTLDHLGFEYKWSVYSPSKKSEIMEAERSKDELRDIMSRMIGAEIRYTQMGFWMRQPPYGFVSEKIETRNGKRCVLRPHPTEADLMRKMYELRARGTLHDEEIVEAINQLGFKTRIHYVRDKKDRTKVVSQRGGKPLTVKAMQKLIRNPIYTGINSEKWTDGKPIRCVFEGLVSVELYNLANKGKHSITENIDGKITIHKKRPPERFVNKGHRNPEFPYRKFVLCPDCERPLLGSSSRGKMGKHYPAYHCSNYGHYFRIPKEQFDATVESFISNLVFSQETVDNVISVIEAEWSKRQDHEQKAIVGIEERIKQLRTEATITVSKIKMISSKAAIKYLEEDIMKIEQQIESLEAERIKQATKAKPNMKQVLTRVRMLMEHPEELLLKQIDPVKRAQFFAASLKKFPTYNDLKPGTQKTPLFTGVHPVFQLAGLEKSLMVIQIAEFWNRIRSLDPQSVGSCTESLVP